jgi:hypothetical protein
MLTTSGFSLRLRCFRFADGSTVTHLGCIVTPRTAIPLAYAPQRVWAAIAGRLAFPSDERGAVRRAVSRVVVCPGHADVWGTRGSRRVALIPVGVSAISREPS